MALDAEIIVVSIFVMVVAEKTNVHIPTSNARIGIYHKSSFWHVLK